MCLLHVNLLKSLTVKNSRNKNCNNLFSQQVFLLEHASNKKEITRTYLKMLRGYFWYVIMCHLYLNLHLFIGIGIFLELQQYFVNYSPPMTMLKHYKHVQKHKELVTLKMNKIFTFIKQQQYKISRLRKTQ